MSRIKNRAAKDRKRRAALRKRLQAAGVNEASIEEILASERKRDWMRRHGSTDDPAPTRDEILANTDDSLWPDDTRFRPSTPDPLLHGAGRATGVTAKVVRRSHTITRHQYERGTDQ